MQYYGRLNAGRLGDRKGGKGYIGRGRGRDGQDLRRDQGKYLGIACRANNQLPFQSPSLPLVQSLIQQPDSTSVEKQSRREPLDEFPRELSHKIKPQGSEHRRLSIQTRMIDKTLAADLCTSLKSSELAVYSKDV